MQAFFFSFFILLLVGPSLLLAQINISEIPCSFAAMVKRAQIQNPKAVDDYKNNEQFIQNFLRKTYPKKSDDTYIIPIVLHVFHNEEEGKLDSAQIQSGLDVLNHDFNGLNEGWNTINPQFDSIKGTLDIQFCLASIAPDGQPTNGILYHDDLSAMNNESEGLLTQHAWDNYKYLNIYLPKYVFGGPSNFTAYAKFPSTYNSDFNLDGIFYSSIRWGYGSQSELSTGQDWASVITHELGHWLNLYHTFQNGCSSPGDFVDDTPPTLGGTIELSGCNNNDFSCGVPANGENFMDYNHDCKKMFTSGQVERMIAALHHPTRKPLWSVENLEATGCRSTTTNTNTDLVTLQDPISLFPNPAETEVTVRSTITMDRIEMLNSQGQKVASFPVYAKKIVIPVQHLGKGLYFYRIFSGAQIFSGRLMTQ